MAARAKAKGWSGTKLLETSKHYGHETHTHGNAIICSCGEMMGIFSIAVSGEAAWSDEPEYCGTCGVEL